MLRAGFHVELGAYIPLCFTGFSHAPYHWLFSQFLTGFSDATRTSVYMQGIMIWLILAKYGM
jgi:hypothetical protein